MTRRVTLHPAPHLRLPGNTDCNSPCFWNARGLHLFTSAQAPSLTSGPSLDRLLHPHAVRMLDDEPRRWWIEAVHLAPDGRLFALYHREDYARLCPDRRWFTIPAIGIAWSRDFGHTWHNLGLVLQDPQVTADPSAITKDESLDMVVEVMGGDEPALSLILAAAKNAFPGAQVVSVRPSKTTLAELDDELSDIPF